MEALPGLDDAQRAPPSMGLLQTFVNSVSVVTGRGLEGQRGRGGRVAPWTSITAYYLVCVPQTALYEPTPTLTHLVCSSPVVVFQRTRCNERGWLLGWIARGARREGAISPSVSQYGRYPNLESSFFSLSTTVSATSRSVEGLGGCMTSGHVRGPGGPTEGGQEVARRQFVPLHLAATVSLWVDPGCAGGPGMAQDGCDGAHGWHLRVVKQIPIKITQKGGLEPRVPVEHRPLQGRLYTVQVLQELVMEMGAPVGR